MFFSVESSTPFGNSLLSMAKAAQQHQNGSNIEIEEIESLEPQRPTPVDIKPDPDDGMDPIERIATKTGTLQTLQKMRTGETRFNSHAGGWSL